MERCIWRIGEYGTIGGTYVILQRHDGGVCFPNLCMHLGLQSGRGEKHKTKHTHCTSRNV